MYEVMCLFVCEWSLMDLFVYCFEFGCVEDVEVVFLVLGDDDVVVEVFVEFCRKDDLFFVV